jgi:hypothetical protein
LIESSLCRPVTFEFVQISEFGIQDERELNEMLDVISIETLARVSAWLTLFPLSPAFEHQLISRTE